MHQKSMGLIELIENSRLCRRRTVRHTFLPNSVALCGSDGEVSDLEGSDIVFVYDNELVTKKLLEESETQLKEEERSSSGHPT